MNWHKLKKQIESFITPQLIENIHYISSGYRYTKDKKNLCYLTLNKDEIFNSNKAFVQWFSSEQDIINNYTLNIPMTQELLINTRKKVGDQVPEDRLSIIATKDLKAMYAKKIMTSQTQLFNGDFQAYVNTYLSETVDNSLKSDHIILNILAIIDRRVGKKRLRALESQLSNKHPIVVYFYQLRLNH